MMDLNSYMGVKQIIDNQRPAIFIQVFGGHAVGKSGIVGRIKQAYPKVTVLGNYSHSKTANGLLTGGMDMFGKTTKERLDSICTWFISNKSVVIAEGAMINAWNPFIMMYYHLQQTRNREVYMVHLYATLEKVCERVECRSQGRTVAAEHTKNYEGKLTHAQHLFEKIEESDHFHKIQFDTTEDFDAPYAYLCKIIEPVLNYGEDDA